MIGAGPTHGMELSPKIGNGGNSEKAAYRGMLDASTSPPKERHTVSNDRDITDFWEILNRRRRTGCSTPTARGNAAARAPRFAKNQEPTDRPDARGPPGRQSALVRQGWAAGQSPGTPSQSCQPPCATTLRARTGVALTTAMWKPTPPGAAYRMWVPTAAEPGGHGAPLPTPQMF